ncbi:MAG: hypothetical protein JOZ81_06085 [Chloroflexi bacterium]|nr:hypothetical protein [Chloroflexota bacterium]
MAVRALPRASETAPLVTASLPAGVLLLALVAPGLDLLSIVQSTASLAGVALAASLATAAVLLGFYVKYPRTSWLAAAALAAIAAAGLRCIGAEFAPVLSLLAVIALGVGGAFASPAPASEIWA